MMMWRMSFVLAVVATMATCVIEQARAGIKNRYSFSEAATADASGRTIIDSVSGANGVVKGAGSSATGTQLVLPGGSSNTQAYVDLPNHLISGLSDATFEAWYVIDSAQAWARVFDFGSTNSPAASMGELTAPGGAGTGLDQVFYAPTRGVNLAQQRVSLSNDDPLFGGTVAGAGGVFNDFDPEFPQVLGQKYHAAVVIDSDGAGPAQGTMALYINGALVVDANGTPNPLPIAHQLGNLNDVNNWLGRSNWTADSNFGGSFDEFRIYDIALNSGQVAKSHANGPDGPVVPEPASITLLLAAGMSGLMALYWYKR